MAEIFAFVVDLCVHRPSDKSRKTVLGWAIHPRVERHEEMFNVVAGLPRCGSSGGVWKNDGYRAWVWFEGNPYTGGWTLAKVGRVRGEHHETALEILENGWHLD